MFRSNDPDIREVCSHSRLFVGLAATELDRVASAAETREVNRKTVLFSQGDFPNRLFILANGLLKISQINGSGDPVTLRMITPSELVACVAVFRQIPYPATATAMIDSHVLSW